MQDSSCVSICQPVGHIDKHPLTVSDSTCLSVPCPGKRGRGGVAVINHPVRLLLEHTIHYGVGAGWADASVHVSECVCH